MPPPRRPSTCRRTRATRARRRIARSLVREARVFDNPQRVALATPARRTETPGRSAASEVDRDGEPRNACPADRDAGTSVKATFPHKVQALATPARRTETPGLDRPRKGGVEICALQRPLDGQTRRDPERRCCSLSELARLATPARRTETPGLPQQRDDDGRSRRLQRPPDGQKRRDFVREVRREPIGDPCSARPTDRNAGTRNLTVGRSEHYGHSQRLPGGQRRWDEMVA